MVTIKKEVKVHNQKDQGMVAIQWSDGFQSSFHYLWLRDNCSAFIDPTSGQRLKNPKNISSDIQAISVDINDHNKLTVKWNTDAHTSEFDLDWLRQHSYSNGEVYEQSPITLWNGSLDITHCELDYEEVMNDKEKLRDWLEMYQKYGIGRLLNVPLEPKIILDIATKISHLWNIKQTPNGGYFEVIGKPSQQYLGHSSKALPAHTDEPYHNPSQPTMILHCLANETTGGESTLADGFKVANDLREQYPEQFKLLVSQSVRFLFKPKGYYYEKITPLIKLDRFGKVEQIYFSDHSMQPLRLPKNVMTPFYEAYCNYSAMLLSDDYQLNFKFKPGDLNLINNYRLVHGRTAFSQSGLRHLQGCYLASDSLISNLALLNQELK